MRRHLYLLIFSVIVASISSLKAQTGEMPENKASLVIKSIEITGNNITKEQIIKREISFTVGGSINISDIDDHIRESRENLMNTSLFNFVTIDTAKTAEGLIVRINVAERWYTWPQPIFQLADRNFNQWLKDKDFTRVNYGLYVLQKNFRGRKEIIRGAVRMGYDELFGFQYTIPYISKKQIGGFGIYFQLKRNHETPYATVHDTLALYKSHNSYAKEEFQAAITYTYRKGIHLNHAAQLGCNRIKSIDTINILNREYIATDYNEIKYPFARYRFTVDYRDSKSYPLKGKYLDFDIYQYGFYKHNNNPIVTDIKLKIKDFLRLSDRIYYALSVTGKTSFGSNRPYELSNSLGYENDFVRGYEYYVVDGEHFVLKKSNIKYAIIKERVLKIGKSEKKIFKKFCTIPYSVYFNIFADAGYVWNNNNYNNNNLPNKMLTSFGVGLDIATYYDRVIRIEYTRNNYDKKRQFYIHFIAPL